MPDDHDHDELPEPTPGAQHGRRFTRPGERGRAALEAVRAQRTSLSAEEVFASNLKTLRGDTGLSQEALAEQMSERGFKWHQATVYKIENGSRQVQLGEAKAVAAILGVPLDRLTDDTDSVQAVSKIRAMLVQLDKYDHQLWSAAMLYEGLREDLERDFYALTDEHRDLMPDNEIDEIRERIGTSAARIASDNERAPF
ncbi:helix-turn-helix domain-containing protein [Nocardia transvalensis]|uniref:helix-turn-helix domain-containing protein n=1 Tax=Nocardia transvalensis TaxID=37333 RepID=UPI001894FC06|nr:helix-turn-helix transcriptional regulator [Nocardia transvalensis]MBF6330258.1 helix-turn-helix transcriptional regulator [Nocardia transvalensis]